MIVMLALLLAGPPAEPASGAGAHFDVSAKFQPTKSGGEIAVTFAPKTPDVHVNVKPAPRLKLALDQKVLVDRPASAEMGKDAGPYLDAAWPVVFPVAVGPGTPPGTHDVRASVTYYYCSKREGWCRKGTAELEVPVTVR
jgi:hypothetical protein